MSPATLLACGLAAIGLAIALLASVILYARARRRAVARALYAIETIYSQRIPQEPPAAERFARLAGYGGWG